MPRDVVRLWCPITFVSHTSKPDHLSTCTLGNVDETESEWNIRKEHHKLLTSPEISWVNVTTPPYTFSHCFLPHLFSKGVKQTDLLWSTVWIQILRNCFTQQNRKNPQQVTPLRPFPDTASLAAPWRMTHQSCSYKSLDMAMRNPSWGSSCLFKAQLLLQNSYKTCSLLKLSNLEQWCPIQVPN